MEERTLNALEFPKVLGHLAKRCSSEAGKEAALSLRPLEDFDSPFPHCAAALPMTER